MQLTVQRRWTADWTPEDMLARSQTHDVPDDVPSDVHAVLAQLFKETETAIRDGEYDTARQTIETATTVSRNKLPEGDRRAWFLHGCGEVLAALTPENGVEEDVAVAYVHAMVRRLPAQ